jgi:hypothetical protein
MQDIPRERVKKTETGLKNHENGLESLNVSLYIMPIPRRQGTVSHKYLGTLQ